MKMLFSKKMKKVEEPKVSKLQDHVAKGIAGLLLLVQNKFASFMSGAINHLSARSKHVCLGMFCLMFGGFSMYAVSGVFRDSKSSVGIIKTDQVSVPKYYDHADSEIKKLLFSDTDIMRINRFKRYMDSLSHSAKGRHEYDSILKVRPYLIDSLDFVLDIYYSQSK